jgi:hypothetical protein
MITVEEFFREDIFPYLVNNHFDGLISSIREETEEGLVDSFHLYNLTHFPSRNAIEISEQFMDSRYPPSEYTVDFFLERLTSLYQSFIEIEYQLGSAENLTICFAENGLDFSENDLPLNIKAPALVSTYTFWSDYSAWRYAYEESRMGFYRSQDEVNHIDSFGEKVAEGVKRQFPHVEVKYRSAITGRETLHLK